MPLMTVRDRQAYRADDGKNHTLLNEKERQRMLQAYLPTPNETPPIPSSNARAQRRSPLGVRRFLKNQMHVLIFAVLHGIFSLYIRVRQMWNILCYQVSSVFYYHHGTPQYIKRDVMALKKKPKHLSVILKAKENHRAKADVERLIDEVAEIATWCACAEIPMLSVYEKTGILKKNMSRVYDAANQKLTFYFGGQHPGLSVTSPHKEDLPASNGENPQGHLRLHLISSQDGRDSMVDLTRTLAEMSQKGKLSPRDISTELIDAELSEGIMTEPELLITFGPYLELSGYPPWQIRLTEIFCLQDNERVGYQVFLKALQHFGKAQMRKGK
ncbi:Decaprenyl diphosphate synthase-like protein [Ilyonectria robusta]|uniref:Decaprenyl diphosphate synthase-like protein n=1 Tax=Ilyonectria robusta TaxID=1079257 RepID=UPI001E8CAD24|nr:Decaprenyl diphosphate synthase-like protein [Ilyonectria robusta]KAH8736759.1 Decaprenyl diphosphate synthase-like protein [Ilyonectria robusta]